MKKIIIMIMISAVGISSYARPHFHHHGHHCKNSWIAPVAIIGGLVAGNLINNIFDSNKKEVVVVTTPQPIKVAVNQNPNTTTPTIVQIPRTVVTYVNGNPITATQTFYYVKVWVPGTYVTQVMPDGRLDNVWIEGHYELQPIQSR